MKRVELNRISFPFTFRQLQSFGISLESQVAVVSDTCIVSVEPDCVTVVDPRGGGRITTRLRGPIDAALMHPSQTMLALRTTVLVRDIPNLQSLSCVDSFAGARTAHKVSILDLETRKVRQSTYFFTPICFWAWTNQMHLALVTTHTVYYMRFLCSGVDSVQRRNKVKVKAAFARHADLADYQITSLVHSLNGRLVVLKGRRQDASGRTSAIAQFYNAEAGSSKIHNCCLAAFPVLNIPSVGPKHAVVAISLREATGPNQSFKITVQSNKSVCVRGMQCSHVDGIPTGMTTDDKTSLAWVMTSTGQIIGVDLLTGFVIFRHPGAGEEVVTANNDAGAVMAVAPRSGRIMRFTWNSSAWLSHALRGRQLDSTVIASVAPRINIPSLLETVGNAVGFNISAGFPSFAVALVAAFPALRTPAILKRFQAKDNVFRDYTRYMIEKTGRLTMYESLEAAKFALKRNDIATLNKWIENDELTLCESIGDLIASHAMAMVSTVYEKVFLSRNESESSGKRKSEEESNDLELKRRR